MSGPLPDRPGRVIRGTVVDAPHAPLAYEFFFLAPESLPLGIVRGPGNRLWYRAEKNGIGAIESTGRKRLYRRPAGNGIFAIAPDGEEAVWFCDPVANVLGRISASGEYGPETTLPRKFTPTHLAVAAGRAVWTASVKHSRICILPLDGEPQEIEATGTSGLVFGSDGRMWATSGARIVAFDAMGAVAFDMLLDLDARLNCPVLSSRGELWFVDGARLLVCHLLPSGDVVEFPFEAGWEPFEIAAGPDGAMWGTFMGGNKIFRLTEDGSRSVITGPTEDAGLTSLVRGYDDNMWFVDHFKARIVRGVT